MPPPALGPSLEAPPSGRSGPSISRNRHLPSLAERSREAILQPLWPGLPPRGSRGFQATARGLVHDGLQERRQDVGASQPRGDLGGVPCLSIRTKADSLSHWPLNSRATPAPSPRAQAPHGALAAGLPRSSPGCSVPVPAALGWSTVSSGPHRGLTSPRRPFPCRRHRSHSFLPPLRLPSSVTLLCTRLAPRHHAPHQPPPPRTRATPATRPMCFFTPVITSVLRAQLSPSSPTRLLPPRR